MEQLLLDLARAMGSEEGATSGSGGWYDVGMVYNKDNSKNTAEAPGSPGSLHLRLSSRGPVRGDCHGPDPRC